MSYPVQQPESKSINHVFLKDVLAGLSQPKKELNCKYFYDERGSDLFDQICQLDEYYLTRTEQMIMDRHVDEMACQIGTGAMLVEFGSGSSIKTRTLIEALDSLVAYVPVDISEDHLLKAADDLRQRYPDVEVLPLVADFTREFHLPQTVRPPSHAAVYFPGSTIGNFPADQAAQVLSMIARVLGSQGGLLIGIDLQKDPSTIKAAYDDSRNITAEFNLNLLHRINRELGGNFNVDQFRHHVEYDSNIGRVESYLVSTRDQTATIQGQEFHFGIGEAVFTEHSHKYTVEGFSQMAAAAEFSLHKYWTDPERRFAVLHLVNERS